MMSRSDYMAVNGYSNEYWRWGAEDTDMYHRIHAVFKTLVRLPQEIGSYSAVGHDRETDMGLMETHEYKRSLAYLDRMRFDRGDARRQLESDGLAQACHHARVIHVENDAAKHTMVVTSHLRSASACSDAAANATKLQLEASYDRDQHMMGTCVRLQRQAGIRVLGTNDTGGEVDGRRHNPTVWQQPLPSADRM